MAYISTQQVKEIRNQLKQTFPKTKFSITRNNYSGVRICILQSDVDFGVDHKSINEFYISENFAGSQKDMLQTIYNIANYGVSYYETGDYGTQPSHYVWMHIGDFDKSFKYKN